MSVWNSLHLSFLPIKTFLHNRNIGSVSEWMPIPNLPFQSSSNWACHCSLPYLMIERHSPQLFVFSCLLLSVIPPIRRTSPLSLTIQAVIPAPPKIPKHCAAKICWQLDWYSVFKAKHLPQHIENSEYITWTTPWNMEWRRQEIDMKSPKTGKRAAHRHSQIHWNNGKGLVPGNATKRTQQETTNNKAQTTNKTTRQKQNIPDS